GPAREAAEEVRARPAREGLRARRGRCVPGRRGVERAGVFGRPSPGPQPRREQRDLRIPRDRRRRPRRRGAPEAEPRVARPSVPVPESPDRRPDGRPPGAGRRRGAKGFRMNTPHSMTLRTRLRALILATSAVALILASGAFLAYDYYSFRGTMESRLRFLSDLLAPQAVASLEGRDKRAAAETLSRLSTAHHVVSAALYAADGSILARYLRPDAADDSVPATAGPAGLNPLQGDLALVRPLGADGRRIGSIYLRADLE